MAETDGWDAADEYGAAEAFRAGDEAVSRAEETVSEAWIAELDLLLSRAHRALALARAARRAAGDRVRVAQRASHPQAVVQAQSALEQAWAAERRCEQEALELRCFTAEEKEWAALAAEQRELTALADQVRLGTAFDGLRNLATSPRKPRESDAQ
ncbi:MAG TPA: hypothetical protein VGX23_08810 [Actinocrinis sp.]|nr:hypothetical protein [Actinocrinis sp.]